MDIRYVSHPLIKPDTVEQRLYQLTLAGSALKSSCLVVLPTGLGKTIISLLVLVSRLEKGKILFLSPTKPLVEQHASFLKEILLLPAEEIVMFTGSTPPSRRSLLWHTARIVVSTPQVIENDLLSKRVSLAEISHITFDEAHRAVGNYAYTYIAEKYFQQAKEPLVLGITASPGSEADKIQEVCENLHISKVEVRTETDPDVKPYIFPKDIEWKSVQVPVEIKGLGVSMERVLTDRLHKLSQLGFIPTNQKRLTKRELLDLQARLQSKLRGFPDQKAFQGISLLAEVFKVSHAIEIAETQGMAALAKYFERLGNEARSRGGSKAAKRLMEDPNMRLALRLHAECREHPKINLVKETVSQQLKANKDSKVIVFTNYRDTAELVVDSLNSVEGVKAVRFVGQQSKYKDSGLTQRQQVDILQKFRDGEYNTLVATSVAEEGLDIPSTDLVLFYEPVPSEIRSIQRKGRTGRRHAGRVVVLVARGTKDEAYYWSSNHREKRMFREIKNLQDESEIREAASRSEIKDHPKAEMPDSEQKKLLDFEGSVRIYVDPREVRSRVFRLLEESGCEVVLKSLEIGDYVLSDRVCVERKTAEDFLSSFLDSDRDLFRQMSDLARTYNRPLLILEGEGLYSARQVHPNAVRGVLASIAIDFGVPIIFSRDEEDTASILGIVAMREQSEGRRSLSSHGKKSALTLKEQQEYLISSIPNIGLSVARNLLRHFGSVRRVLNASFEELLVVDLVGPKTAERIREVASGEYKG